MPSLLQGNSNTTATPYTAATEVAAITSTDLINTLDAEGQGVMIIGQVSFTAGATGGTVTAKVHQGSGLGGATVATIPLTNAIASQPNSYPIVAFDPAPAVVGPGNAGTPIYTISLTVAGSNGTGSYASIAVVQIAGDN